MNLFKKERKEEEVWDVPVKQMIDIYSREYPSKVVESQVVDVKHFEKWKKKKKY